MGKFEKIGSDGTLTPEMAGQIKWYLINTDLTYMQIASLVGMPNIGRVSEVKNGKRFADVPPTPPKKRLH